MVDRDLWPCINKETPEELNERLTKKSASLLDIVLFKNVKASDSDLIELLLKLRIMAFLPSIFVRCRGE